MNNNIENISINNLLDINDISVETYNICKYNNINDLEQIIIHFLENSNFKKLQNCGDISNKELLTICKKYNYFRKHLDNQRKEIISKNPFVQAIETFSSEQENIINNLITSKFKKLSIRSSKALSSYLNSSINISGLNEYYFKTPNFDFKVLKNVGITAKIEMTRFLSDIKKMIESVSELKDEADLKRELLSSFLIKQFSVSTETIDAICNDYDFKNGIPIFKTIYYLIEHGYIFDVNEKIVFNYSIGFFEDKIPDTIKETSKKIGLTKERARQIRIQLIKRLGKFFNLFSELDIDLINLYNINLDDELIDFDKKLVEEISKTESVNFNILFINRLLANILSKYFTLVGNDICFIFRITKKKLYSWKATYLVSKSICSEFDFEKMIDDVSSRLSKRIAREYKLNLQSYLLNFQKTESIGHLNSILEISKYILSNELGVIPDNEDNIVFKRTSNKLIVEYIIEVLEEANKPLTNVEIYERLSQTKPGILKNLESVRSNSIKESRIICFGRTSTYGLKSWEDKQENIKGGTMHDIAEEYLLKYDTPKHVDEIAEYVNIYRNNISSRNLLDNLKSARKRRFVFFEGRYIGSCKIEYKNFHKISLDNKQIILRSWEDNFRRLCEFATKNNRLPYSSSLKEEKKLYGFLNLQIRRFENFDKNRKEKISKLLDKYNYQKGKKHINEVAWENSYKSLNEFIIENKRGPMALKTDEKYLYDFFYSQRKLFHEKRLSKKHGSQFLNILRLLNEVENL
ncbi:MAG: hypothetical protein JEY97_09430 [Bacteroidales bacterium]|nr:hypothetical protein [Bacteroidales bacterium]